MSDTTAILIFARPVASDAAHKRLASQPLVGQQVLALLNQRVKRTAEGTGLPVLHSAGLTSHRGTFGEQLTEALRAAFALGFERVLVIGNDCPALATHDLIRAADRLHATPVVLGPDRRGGLYLLGLSRDAFDTLSLASLPWQTDRLAQALDQICSACPVSVLSPLGDVNNRMDLRHYYTTSPAVALFVARLLKLGAADQALSDSPWFIRLSGICPGICSLRAPPAFGAAAIAAC